MKNKEDTKCIVKSCTNKIFVKKLKLCTTHANQLYRDGVVQTKPIKKRKIHDTVIFVD
jgi:hypothetical protein